MGRKNSVGTANGLPNGERAGGAAAGSGAPVPCHLLVMRTSAMGDVAMLPHALRALTAAYPDLRVTVATQAMFRPFFAGLDVGFLDVDVKGAHHFLAGMWRLAAQARRLGVDAVADVHDVLRSKAFRLAMRLHGVPAAHIDKGRAGKRAFIRCGGRGMEPLRHTVLRYCDVFRKLGFVLDDPAPAVRRDRPNPFGEKHGVWVGFAPFSAHRGKTYPEEQSRELVRMLSRGVGMGRDASRAGFSGLRGFVRERFAGRHGVPSLLGLRQQALPLRRLPLPESRYARNGGPAGGRNHRQLAGMFRKRINRLNP